MSRPWLRDHDCLRTDAAVKHCDPTGANGRSVEVHSKQGDCRGRLVLQAAEPVISELLRGENGHRNAHRKASPPSRSGRPAGWQLGPSAMIASTRCPVPSAPDAEASNIDIRIQHHDDLLPH